MSCLPVFQEMLEAEFEAVLSLSHDQMSRVLSELSNADDRSYLFLSLFLPS